MKHFQTLKALAAFLCANLVAARGDGYYGYSLSRRGDNSSAYYETEGTTNGIQLAQEPDVSLNASLSVGEISIEVQNLTAKINLDAKVLNLLNFNAGVDASINRVKLGIYNVTAKVELEARLGNILQMVDDVLTSIDLNPLIATLGDGVADIVDDVGDVIGGDETEEDAETLRKRDLTHRLEHNILYAKTDFSGSVHTNRVLAQNGSLVDITINNQGVESRRKTVGFYSQLMTFTGHNRTIVSDEGQTQYELQYLYEPYRGLDAYCNIYVDTTGIVLRTKVVAEAEGGAAATIANEEEV